MRAQKLWMVVNAKTGCIAPFYGATFTKREMREQAEKREWLLIGMKIARVTVTVPEVQK